MISLIDISRAVGHPREPKVLFDRLTLRVEPFEHVGILATSGSGKTTLTRIIAGLENPDSGLVERNGTISWPIGFSSALHPGLSAAENTALIARLHNLYVDEFVLRVQDFCELGSAFHKPVCELSPGMRNQLGQSLSLSTDFDVFLADDMSSVSAPGFRDKCDAAILDKGACSAMIFLSRHARVIKQYASTIYVLTGGKLTLCESAEHAEDILKYLQSKEQPEYALV